MKNITCSQSSSRKGFVIIAGTTLGKEIIGVNKMVEQKSETNELKTGLSVLSYGITQNVMELTVKNLMTHNLVCHIELLQQSALYYALYAVWEDRLRKRRRVDDLLI
jgi:hypothetical protein